MGSAENTAAFFVTDLHGKISRYEKLFQAIMEEKPGSVFIGGDILPHLDPPDFQGDRFLEGYFLSELEKLRENIREAYPRVFLILGNDDGRNDEPLLADADRSGLLDYVHGRRTGLLRWQVFGYSYVPPTPFRLKDWEKYDVSRYVDIGAVSPEKGSHSVEVDKHELKYGTIKKDLQELTEGLELDNGIFLFHSPPYKSSLDRADLDGVMIDHAPLDVHVGSIAISRFIRKRQPLVTMHGHIHESARLTGHWKEEIGRTVALSAAHDGPELALVRFDLDDPAGAQRELL